MRTKNSMPRRARLFIIIIALGLFAQPVLPARAGDLVQVLSPDRKVRIRLFANDGQLKLAVTFHDHLVIEPSPLRMMISGTMLTTNVELGAVKPYEIHESYPWYGSHSVATNDCKGVLVSLRLGAGDFSYTLDLRAYNDAAAFRFVIPGDGPRVPDEATTFVVPAGSTIWYHGIRGHYEGVHTRAAVEAVPTGDWAAPPVTFKLPGRTGYASITEAGLTNYAGMALLADGHRGFTMRLGHAQPPSYAYRLRYSQADIERIAKPAVLTGVIATPWRVVMIGADLNALVNSDVVHNLCPPPDPNYFPQGLQTDWVRPGRAVWKYLDGGGSNTVENMKEFTRLAGELGFEHHVLEGFWNRWTDDEIRDLVSYANQRHVGIMVWRHSKFLYDPQVRHDLLKRCHDLGIEGLKIDFFDNEAKEAVDLYSALLKEGAEYHLVMDFHGANKPTGLSRTWPNELTREAVRGMEGRMQDRATHETTLPFTRFLAGPAEYTPVIFNERRANTTWAHQVASAAILSAPLLTYAANPTNILANPCCDMLKSIPSVWDETVVLPPSEIGEAAVFARRSGQTWFLAVMNGRLPRTFNVRLSFLGDGSYQGTLIRDDARESGAVKIENATLKRRDSVSIQMGEGGGFIARFTKS